MNKASIFDVEIVYIVILHLNSKPNKSFLPRNFVYIDSVNSRPDNKRVTQQWIVLMAKLN